MSKSKKKNNSKKQETKQNNVIEIMEGEYTIMNDKNENQATAEATEKAMKKKIRFRSPIYTEDVKIKTPEEKAEDAKKLKKKIIAFGTTAGIIIGGVIIALSKMGENSENNNADSDACDDNIYDSESNETSEDDED